MIRRLASRLLVPPDLAASLARIERKLDVERKEVKALRAQLKSQADQIKVLRAQQEKAAVPSRLPLETKHFDKRLARLSARLERSSKLRAKWETGVTWQLNALIRKLFLPTDVPFPFKLAARRFKLRSQHEEDGYLLALLDAVGTTNRRFVEIGCGRSGGNAAVLAFELGWSGLMVDANPDAIDYVTRVYAFNDTVQAVVAEVTPENVNALLAAHGCSGEVDLLSIDIDSYDYWVFDALEACSPRVLMLEYNAGFGPTRHVTIPKGALVADAPKGYSGASLAALTKLAARKGYRLIACEYSGVNALYLRSDVAVEIPAQPVGRAYRPQMSRLEVDVERPGPDDVFRKIAERNLPLQEV